MARLGGKLGWGPIRLEGTASLPGWERTGLQGRRWRAGREALWRGETQLPEDPEPRGVGGLARGVGARPALPGPKPGRKAALESSASRVQERRRKRKHRETHIYSKMSLPPPSSKPAAAQAQAREGFRARPQPRRKLGKKERELRGHRSSAWHSPGPAQLSRTRGRSAC